MFALIVLLAQLPVTAQPDVANPKQPVIQIAQAKPPTPAELQKKAEDDMKKVFDKGIPPEAKQAAAVGAGIGIVFMIIYAVILLLFWGGIIVGTWMTFSKAGRPGWISLIPFWNLWTLAEVAGKPGINGLLCAFLMPCCYLGLIWYIPMMLGLSRKFGKETGFAIGLMLLPWLFLPILGFSSAEYQSKGKKKKKRSRDDDDEDDDDDDRGRRRPRDDDDEDDDDRPRRRPRSKDNDEDEDDRPRRKRPANDDDDEGVQERRPPPAPPKRRPVRDDDDDDEPPRRKPSRRDDDDDDEPPPRRRR